MTDKLAIVQRYFAAFAEGDIESALACVHPEAIWHVDGDPALVTAGITRGRAAVADWLRRFPTGFQPLAFSIDHLIESRCDVIALGHFRHIVRATGAIADSDYAIRFTIQDGLIARYQIFEDSLLLAQAHQTGSQARSARLNGLDYAWNDAGRGPPVVFLHGLFLDRTFWSAAIEAIAETRRCIAFDMPGHGASGWRDELDLDGIADDIALWLAEHNASGATLVGHSQGGMIAMRIAARWPELVERLFLVNTSARAEYADRLSAWRERRAALLGNAVERKALFATIQQLKSTERWLHAHPLAANHERDMMMRHDPQRLALALDAAVLNRSDIRSILPDIRSPTIVISGEEDQATPADLGREIADMIHGADCIVVPAVAHHVPIEAVPVLIDAILNEPNPALARQTGSASVDVEHPMSSV